MTKLFVPALLLGILLAPSHLYAQDNRDLVPETWESIRDKLQLTQDQLLRVREIKERNSVEIAKLKEKLEAHVAELKRMLEHEPVDHQKLEQAVQEIGRLQTQKVRLQTHTIYEIRSILSPEQKRLLKSFRRGNRELISPWSDVAVKEAS
jgi:Spy/CpxP family protein refolding chaperone